MEKWLQGRSAIVTGAGRGIGREIALALAGAGARVMVNDVGGESDGSGTSALPADEVVAEIKKRGGEAVANYDSVADFQRAKGIVQTALDSFGRLDVLVNNAGIVRRRPLLEMTEGDWDLVIAVHLKGHFNMCRHAAPVMRDAGYGRIINTASGQWIKPESGVNYGAAKGGIVSFTRGLAWELKPLGITVNAVAPNAATRLHESLRSHHDELLKKGLISPQRYRWLQNWPGPEFVPPMVVYLATEQASYITGQVFRCVGGQISLFSVPEEPRIIFRNHAKEGPWSVDELMTLVPRTLMAEPVPTV